MKEELSATCRKLKQTIRDFTTTELLCYHENEKKTCLNRTVVNRVNFMVHSTVFVAPRY
jgi:hypothetical protein